MSNPPTGNASTQASSAQQNAPGSIGTQDAPSSSLPTSKPASPAAAQEQKLNYAQAAGKATSSSGTSTPANQQPGSSATTPTSAVPPQQPSTPISNPLSNVSINVSYPNGTAKPVAPPTGPSALNGSRNHSRASSATTPYRAAPPQGPHSSKPSLSGQPAYYSAQSPRIPAINNGGRNSPFVDYHDENRRSPPQSRNGSIAGISMTRHGSQSSQSDRQIPPSPRPNNRPAVATGPYQAYPYQQPPFNPAYNQPIPGRSNFRPPPNAPQFQQGMQQFQRPPRSPMQQNISIAAPMYGMSPQLQVQPVTAPGQYYIPTHTDQFGNQLQGQYMFHQQFHAQQQPPHVFPPQGPPQLFSPPPQNLQSGFSSNQRPMNQPMSRSGSLASDINHQPPQHPSATPPPAPKEETSTFVKPKKSAAIRIVNPETKAEVKFTKPEMSKAPDRSPSPAVKTPQKSIPRGTHSPAPSLDADRPASAAKTKEEITEEMRAKVQQAKRKQEEEERLERERILEEERKKKEEEEQLEREQREKEERERREEEERRHREEERKQREEEERIKREMEEAERKAEEERIAAQTAKEEEEARIAKQKAEEEAALEAARLAKEREEAEAKAREEEANSKAREEEAKAKEAELAGQTVAEEETEPLVEERRSSIGGQRKTAPAPLAIKSGVSIPEGLQSAALKTATFIKTEDFLNTKYPDGFTPPDPAINAKFGGKGFHYNVEFLYQFKDIYKDKPSEDWDQKIKETMGDLDRNPRPTGGPSRTVSSSQFAAMGQFAKSNPIPRHPPTLPPVSTSSLQFSPIVNPYPARPTRQMSGSGQGVMAAPASPSGRQQSKSQRQNSRRQPLPPPPQPAESPVEPLAMSATRWKVQRQETAIGPPPGGTEAGKLSPEMVQRKVKSLLNKLTLEKFDKITDQILEIASQSRQETDGRTLRQIIQLTFEKATDEPNFSEMYALFCRKIMETIDPNITDPTVLNKDGQPLTGGQLFRKYLLNRCQEEFERGWKVNLPPKPDENAVGKEAELLSDAYYAATKAKRQGLGLVQFIGELFKLNMLIEKIMYECIIRLLGGTDDPHPEPEEVESLCRLLSTVGKALDEGKAKTRMNAIYEALDQIRLHSDLESRIKFKILDVLEVRRAGWSARHPGLTGPKTIQQIHDDAAKAKADAEVARQTLPRSRAELGRGDARHDAWGTAPRPNKVDNRAGDMSKLGMVRTSSATGLGPQTAQFSSMRSQSSRNRSTAGNTLNREGSGQSSRTNTPGVATPPSVTSANTFDIFRSESEAKDEEHMPASSRVRKAPASDEVPEGTYYTIPPIQAETPMSSVPNFVIGRKGIGTISFKAPVDLTDISSLSALQELVKIQNSQVTLYPNESKRPPAGSGLNVRAEVSLNYRLPPDIDLEEYKEELKSTYPSTKFISYDAEKGQIVYEVEQFTTSS